MKIDFFLMGRKGLRVLEHVCASRYKTLIGAVVSARDSAMKEDITEAIAACCAKHSISFSLKETYTATGNADYRILVGWKWMVEEKDTIVLHDALLPAYRGFAPLVNALIEGETVVGATAIWAAGRYDTGPVIAQRRMQVVAPLRINDALDAMAGLYVEIVMDILDGLGAKRRPAGIPQDETAATYSLWRDEEDYFINWKEDSRRIQRTVYALSFPYKGACALLNHHKIILEDVVPVNDVTIVNRQVGKVIFIEDGMPVVVCGSGLLKIVSAFNEADGKSILPFAKFRSRFSSPGSHEI
jgi:methionyl-tRNA formyltransferase